MHFLSLAPLFLHSLALVLSQESPTTTTSHRRSFAYYPTSSIGHLHHAHAHPHSPSEAPYPARRDGLLVSAALANSLFNPTYADDATPFASPFAPRAAFPSPLAASPFSGPPGPYAAPPGDGFYYPGHPGNALGLLGSPESAYGPYLAYSPSLSPVSSFMGPSAMYPYLPRMSPAALSPLSAMDGSGMGGGPGMMSSGMGPGLGFGGMGPGLSAMGPMGGMGGPMMGMAPGMGGGLGLPLGLGSMGGLGAPGISAMGPMGGFGPMLGMAPGMGGMGPLGGMGMGPGMSSMSPMGMGSGLSSSMSPGLFLSPPKIEIGQKLSNSIYANNFDDLGDNLRYDMSAFKDSYVPKDTAGGHYSSSSSSSGSSSGRYPSSYSSETNRGLSSQPSSSSSYSPSSSSYQGSDFALASNGYRQYLSQQQSLLSNPTLYNRISQYMPYMAPAPGSSDTMYAKASDFYKSPTTSSATAAASSLSPSSAATVEHLTGSKVNKNGGSSNGNNKEELGFFKRSDVKNTA